MSGGPGQLLTSVVGAGVGFMLGGTWGAAIGWQLGSLAGGIIWPMDPGSQVGPRLSDRTVQTSSYGVPIPWIWGRYRTAGNVIWATDIVEVENTRRIGKTLFSKGQKVTTYTYFGNFAVLVCQRDIGQIGRIWADGKLIHDPAIHGKFDGYIRKYTGSEDQMPDPALEADKGVGQVPAFRGRAYVVFDGLPLADFGNRLPQMSIEVGQRSLEPSWQSAEHSGLSILGWSYNPAFPDRAIQATTGEVRVFDLSDLSQEAIWTPGADGDVQAATFAMFGSPWGTSATTIQGVAIDGATGDAFVSLSGTGGVSAMTRWSVVGAAVTLQWVTPYNGQGIAGGVALFEDGLFALNRDLDTAFRFHRDTGALIYGTDLSSTGTYSSLSHRAQSACRRGTQVFYTIEHQSSGAVRLVRLNWTTGAPTGTLELTPSLTGANVVVYDTRTDRIIVHGEFVTLAIDPDSLSVALTVPRPAEAQWFVGSAEALLLQNVGQDGAVDGFFYAHSLDTVYRLSTLDFSIVWSDSVDDALTGIPNTDIGSTLALAGPGRGRAFLTPNYGLSVYEFGQAGTNSDLPTILRDICAVCDLSATDIDTSDLTDVEVTGYMVGRESTGRAAIEPLMAAFAFDAPERDGKLVFQGRKPTTDVVLTRDDLGASSDAGADIDRVTERRKQEIELPLGVLVKYASLAFDYQIATQQAKRISAAVEAGDPTSLEFPLVLSDEQAKAIAARVLYLAWIERMSYTLTLPPRFIVYDPGDILDIPVDDQTAVRMIAQKVEIGGDGVVSLDGVATDSVVYLPPPDPPAIPILPPQSVPVIEIMDPVVIDAPLLADEDDGFGYYLGGRGTSTDWNGGEVYASKDGTTWEWAITTTQTTPVGVTTTALPFHPSALFDRTNTVRVSLSPAVTLESLSERDVLAGGNRLMIGSELLGFATATLISAGVWDLSVLLRGQQGTEWASDHASGASVVLLDAIQSVEAPLSDLGQSRWFKGVSVGATLDDADAEAFTGQGVRLKPLSPVHIAGERDLSDNLTLTWTRRARIDADWRDSVETPLDEPVEAYDIDVMNGSSVVRTLSSGAASVVYSAADQVADFGTTQASVSVIVYQLSTRVGRGYGGSALV